MRGGHGPSTSDLEPTKEAHSTGEQPEVTESSQLLLGKALGIKYRERGWYDHICHWLSFLPWSRVRKDLIGSCQFLELKAAPL